ncbi:hypothetical protein H257_18152 [Aphanomyces astaci]|uniref:Uncharacterized protein n=1 Tax=Aphanomyces astaci TaxID=112090 RepID=W4FC95_APHAT|nr:hypothetical protein H257_18152 [Aphanomyces astaci]ETV65065.1 hypothetical protein H257_18152 [Aphanomyces astaci]|eukprot:XP_009845464.1 hypothetical protein H257_18152 [Aphanomyces astaci]
MSTPVKNRFSEYEDVLILREVNARLPFMAKRGLVMVGWAAVAEAVASQEEFSRPGFDAKRAQNRFTLLLEGHRVRDDESMRASGVAEDYNEKSQLLDELSSVYDDWKKRDKLRLEDVMREAERVETMGATIREEAMQSLGKRKKIDQVDGDAGGGNNGGTLAKMMKMMHDDNNAELEFRKYQYEKDQEEREAVRSREYEERRNSITHAS